LKAVELRRLEAEELKAVEKELQRELRQLQEVEGLRKVELAERQKTIMREMERLKQEQNIAQ
jgi:hypothetical protein